MLAFTVVRGKSLSYTAPLANMYLNTFIVTTQPRILLHHAHLLFDPNLLLRSRDALPECIPTFISESY